MNTITPLTPEERAVLEICANNGVIADIGEYSKWHDPINSLLRRGFLQRHDQFNNSITPAGRAAYEEHGDDDIREIIHASNAINGRQAAASAVIAQIAENMAKLARVTSALTGDEPKVAAKKWFDIALEATYQAIDREN